MTQLEQYRAEIDRIDRQLVELWAERTRITDAVGRYKLERGIPVLDADREAALLEEKKGLVADEGLQGDVVRLYETILSISRDRQQRLGDGEKNLILIGMMGCGKTTIGTRLAEKLNRTLVDTDALIEAEEGCSISALFETKGEEYFREKELELSEKLAQRRGLIIACGGGLPLLEGCMAGLKKSSVVIWLCRDPGESYDGLDISGRPLAQQGREAFLECFARREPVYRQWADIIVEEFSSPEKTLCAVLEALK